MELDLLIDRLAAEGELLAEAAGQAGPTAAVPSCPEWTVRELVVHTGGVHRWADQIVGGRLSTDPLPDDRQLERPEPDQDPIAWFRAGLAELVATLRAAPADLGCFTFLPTNDARRFWIRRQAHETAIHRVDAELAADRAVTEVPAEFALDGIDELLFSFGALRRRPRPPAVRLALCASDGPDLWVRFGTERVEVGTLDQDESTDATVTGTASELYRWLWNRPAPVVIGGDAEAAARWSGSVRVRWV